MPGTSVALLVAAVSAGAVLAGVIVMTVVLTRRRRARFRPVPPPAPVPPQLPAVVVNPTRFGDVAALRAQITAVCTDMGWAEPLWLETTVEDPGSGQARAALAAGADMVLACGGDGTIRNVAQVLAGSGTALGLLPAGTGNLLARNLAVQLCTPAEAARVALAGASRCVDVGWVLIDDAAEEQVFLVMAGMGFDAAIMAGARSAWKERIGPLAYFVSGLRALNGPHLRVALNMDDQPELRRRVRTVVVGNCGKLLAGLVLMPAARIDDGLLDVVTIAPKGIVGWVAVAARVMTRRRSGHPRVEHWQGGTVTIAAERPQPAQLDGDPVGEAQVLRMRIDHGALVVRVPSGHRE